MEEESQSEVETKENLDVNDGDKCGEKEAVTAEAETEDTFKKPAAFAKPKRTNDAAENKVADGCEAAAGEKQRRDDTAVDKPEKQEVKAKKVPVNAGEFPPLPYSEPSWGAPPPDSPYALEVLKNGAIVDTVPLTLRSYFVVGRLPVCDVSLEHPSISRYHAVVQYRGEPEEERGFFIYDLGSTHGTVVNKNRIPPQTHVRLRVGHVVKFGGSTRLFILHGPESDEEEESELTVTELREQARKRSAELEKRMMGDHSDGEDDEKNEAKTSQREASSEDSGCTWGMEEDAAPEEDENEENPFSTEFHEDQEAAYLKDPKKALQGFYDREGEELEFEYEDQNHGTWLCRIKLPVDDALGRQLVAEVSHTGKKKEAAVQCCLEACRMLEARGLLRQEAVSRKRKKKNWEDEDYYDSDDDTFLDRTGTVERKRQERMKKAGKIEDRTETYESLVSKLSSVEKELGDAQKRLGSTKQDSSASAAEDSLDAFMTAVRSEAAMDTVERRKLHVHVADLRKEAQRLRKLVELTRPAQMPSLSSSGSSEPEKPKKSLPLFGAMKGGNKFKLKTGTIGKLPSKRANLPAELFNMKELPPEGEQEEEEKEEEEKEEKAEQAVISTDEELESSASLSESGCEDSRAPLGHLKDSEEVKDPEQTFKKSKKSEPQVPPKSAASVSKESKAEGEAEPAAEQSPRKKKRAMGPSRPPVQLSGQYPQDDPDYSVWMPPVGQTGDGRTHLNDKYGY